ncbi:MAG: SLC13 family permease [Pseudomonadota bacterium]
MEALGLTFEMVMVLGVLALTMFLFVSEIVRVDVAAIIIMVLLGCLAALPGLENLVDVRHLFDGFGSNAVISIIAVMIIGAGLDRTGVMSTVAGWITKIGGTTESRLIMLISTTVGVISSFMQNVGAAALFLPVVNRVAVRTSVPMSRLLMPMGFCAILGGTITMVGSSPLILLNDLILGINETIPANAQMDTFELFDVAPVGLALVATGILYFIFLGKLVLPKQKAQDVSRGRSLLEYYDRIYGLKGEIHEVIIPGEHAVNGKTIDDLEQDYGIQIIATNYRGKTVMAPTRDIVISSPARLAVIGEPGKVDAFLKDTGLKEAPQLLAFATSLGSDKSGIAEIVVRPEASIIGKTGREMWFRRIFGLSPLVIYRGGETLTRDRAEIGRTAYQAGDLLVCHSTWAALTRLESNKDFVVVTSDYPREVLRPQKLVWALLFFSIALGLVLFSDLRLSLCLLVGAIGMIVSRVLSIEEAYDSVGWNTVFLLASLIPLGQAVQSTGTAEWIADQFLSVLDGMPVWVIQGAVAVLATAFTLVMSNVGATVLLVPLAVNIALGIGASPALFALTVAISTSNSFLIPTHQVNALIMGPGAYRVADFMRAGGIMTILFLIVSMLALNAWF